MFGRRPQEAPGEKLCNPLDQGKFIKTEKLPVIPGDLNERTFPYGIVLKPFLSVSTDQVLCEC